MRRPLSLAAEMMIGAIAAIALNVGVAIAFIVLGMLSASVFMPLSLLIFLRLLSV
jgi:hypothetical protein